MCLTPDQLRHIKKKILNWYKITLTWVVVNDLFKNIKKEKEKDNIFYIEADYIWGRKKKLFGWRSKIKDYSIILGAGIHVIDLVMWLLNKRPRSVIAVANKIATSKTVYKKNSMALLILEFPGNIIAKITANAAAIHKHFHEIKTLQMQNYK